MLEVENNRNILARHIGVEAVSCLTVATLGWKARHIVQEVADATVLRKGSLSPAYENRLYKYQPEAVRILVFFFAFQVKNLIDSIVWA